MQNQSHFGWKDAQIWIHSKRPKETLLGSKLLERLTDCSIFLLNQTIDEDTLVLFENSFSWISDLIYDICQDMFFKDPRALKTKIPKLGSWPEDIKLKILELLFRAIGNCLVLERVQAVAAQTDWLQVSLRVLRGAKVKALKTQCLRALMNYSTRSLEEKRRIVSLLQFEFRNLRSGMFDALGVSYLEILADRV